LLNCKTHLCNTDSTIQQFNGRPTGFCITPAVVIFAPGDAAIVVSVEFVPLETAPSASLSTISAAGVPARVPPARSVTRSL
jgi:hypothetical protein